jgi:hypothetical protein
MANRFANGAKAFGFCDLCGFRFDLKKLKNLVVKTKQTQIKACPQCWTPDQPQLQLGMYPISDPQAIREPRPDTNTWYLSGVTATGSFGGGSRVIEWGWNPVGGSRGFDAALTPNALAPQGLVGTVAVNPPGGIFVNYALLPFALLQAGVGVEPAKLLFSTTKIGTRSLGDINNNGTVTVQDSSAYLFWTNNVAQTAAFNTYIQDVLNPYMISNSSTYAAYLLFT